MAEEALLEQVLGDCRGRRRGWPRPAAATLARASRRHAGRLARRVGSGLHPHDPAGAARDVEALLPRRGARAGQHPGRGAGAARGEPLRRHPDRGHVRLRPGLLRPLRAAATLPPARPRPRLQAARRARQPVALRDRAGLAGEHADERSSATPRCSSTPAATTRPTGPRGSRARSTSPAASGFARLAIEHGVPDRAGRGDRRPGDRALPRAGPRPRATSPARPPAAR